MQCSICLYVLNISKRQTFITAYQLHTIGDVVDVRTRLRGQTVTDESTFGAQKRIFHVSAVALVTRQTYGCTTENAY